MTYQQEYRHWLEEPSLDENTREELQAISGDTAAIEDRFYTELAFGTAGLRGIIGAGSNRMNVYVVRRATQGLSDYLKQIPGAREKGVAIAYDSRRYSSLFALETAQVLAGNGIKAYLFESLRAVPQLSFTVRHLACIAGVVITASHNPPAYNGYKVYWEDGGQIGPKQADAVMQCIQRVPWFQATMLEKGEAIRQGLITIIGNEVDEAYYAATRSLLLEPALVKAKGGDLRLVYTPLFGAGCIPVQTLLSRIGITNIQVVQAQAAPNPDFPGLSAPNPEDPAAFTLAFQLANETGADAILATDPDSDRLGIAVRKRDGQFAVLTGNQIGCLLLYHILSTRAAQGTLPSNGLVVKSLVSTRLADAICSHYGVKLEEVLTGFRFISEKIDHAQRTGESSFLFGFEESYGFLSGGFSRDKDAVCAAMLAAEACVCYKERGMTLYDGLQEIYRSFGYYGEKVHSYTLMGKEGMERIAAAMAALRRDPPLQMGGVAVTTVEDYLQGTATQLPCGQCGPLTLPASNVLRLLLQDGCWVCVRPSGTEPKLKLYVGASASGEDALSRRLDTLYHDIHGRLTQLLQS